MAGFEEIINRPEWIDQAWNSIHWLFDAIDAHKRGYKDETAECLRRAADFALNARVLHKRTLER